MKKIVALIHVMLVVGIAVNAQTRTTTTLTNETYVKVYDDPTDVIKGHIAVEFYGVDVGFKNLSGAMLFVTGVNAQYPISDKLAVEGHARLPLLRLKKEGTGFIFDAGAMLTLASSTVDKDVTVILAMKEEDVGGGYRRRETKYVTINGSVKKSLVLRGGVYLKSTAIEYKEGMTDYYPENLFHKGIYIGIGKQRQYFFQLERNQRGEKAVFGAGSIFRPYIDVMVLPTTVDLQQNTFGLGAGTSKELTGLLGGRVGFRWYRNPFTREQNNNRRIPFLGNAVVTLEAGSRPLDGFFFNGAISFIVHKF